MSEGTTEEVGNEPATTQTATPPPAATMEKSPPANIQENTTTKISKSQPGKIISAAKMPEPAGPAIPEAAEPSPPSEPKSGAPLLDVRPQSVELHNYYRSLYGNLSRKINGTLKFLESSNGTFVIFSKFFKKIIAFFTEIVSLLWQIWAYAFVEGSDCEGPTR